MNDARKAWWRDARFGLFIHWGLYSVPAGVVEGKALGGGEWIMATGKVSLKDYADYAKQFDAAKFDADAWVRLAKESGMKYIVITAKHHDGFAMFKTNVDRYNIVDATPFKRDPLAELAAACKKHGLKLGFYYSQGQDWHHPGGGIAIGSPWDDGQKGDFATYVKTVAEPQVKELLTNYGPIAVFWYDTPTLNMTPALAAPFKKMMREFQPDMFYNDRLYYADGGDFETPEQFVPPRRIEDDWETCMTMNGSWGYVARDQNYKPVNVLIRHLAAAAARGGNFLLNVGPDSHGEIPQPQADRLRAVGEWLRINGESVYGTTAGPFTRPLPFGVATAKPGKIFLHVFDRPEDHTLWLPANATVTKAYFLADPQRTLVVGRRDGGLTVTLTGTLPDAADAVVVVEYAGAFDVFAPATTPAPDGTFTLDLSRCDLAEGKLVTSWTQKGPKPMVDLRKSTEVATWTASVEKAGPYAATLSAAAFAGKTGRGTLTIGGKTIDVVVPPAPGQEAEWVSVRLGTIDLPSGRLEIRLRGNAAAADAVPQAALRFDTLSLTPTTVPAAQ